MLFREASLTSLRRDSTRGTKRMDGRFATNSPSSRSAILDLCSTLPLPTDLHPDIYYSQYYRARLYCVSRKASNGQLTLPRLPRPRSFPPPSLPPPLSTTASLLSLSLSPRIGLEFSQKSPPLRGGYHDMISQSRSNFSLSQNIT